MANEPSRILLVDDEEDILEFMRYNLEREGYSVATATGGEQALELARGFAPALIVLDVMMPGMDGLETCRALRRDPAQRDTVVAFLTARAEDHAQIAGLDAGADDYIVKPIKPRLLVSKIKALLKRSPGVRQSEITENEATTITVTIGGQPITIDRTRHQVTRGGERTTLPRKEFGILELLAARAGQVVTRELITDTVWGGDAYASDRTINVHISKLRQTLGEECIETLKGVGYRLRVDEQ